MPPARSSPAAFLYLAARPTGGRTMGIGRARSPRALSETLRRDRLVVLRAWRLPDWVSPEPPMGMKDHAELDAQLGSLLSRGVPLVEALEVAGSVVSDSARERVSRMRDAVREGAGFSEACRRVGSFDPVTIAVYSAAERTGDLAGACRRLSESQKRLLAVRGKAATLMIYPAIVLSISTLVGLGMLTFILPMIGGSLQKANRPVPAITEWMMAIGLWIRGHALELLIAVAGLAVAAFIVRSALAGVVGVLSRRTPRLKDVIRAQESARFFSVMAAMSRSGIPLADALSVANDAISDPTLRKDLDGLRQGLVDGGVLRTLIERATALPLATRRLLIAADQAGDLDAAFENLADDFAAEVDVKTARLMALLEPSLIVLMFLIIGSMILSILVPLMTATTQGI